MIEIIFSYLNRLKKSVDNIVDTGNSDMYGTGELGNVYYGKLEDAQVPTFMEFDKKIFSDNSPLPIARPAHYKNLYIDEDVTLNTVGDAATILVQDTLYLHGSISCASTHTGNYTATSVVPLQLPKLKMFGETKYLVTEPFIITGGTNNPCFGNSDKGGGFTAIYFSSANHLASNNTIGENIADLQSFVNVLGGTTGVSSGGCLIIAARNIAIAATGRIVNTGGDGTNAATAGLLCQYHMTGRTSV